MCGIIASLSHNEDISSLLINGLIELRNRGYDSAGIGVSTNNEFSVVKSINTNSMDELKEIKNAKIGIGHTRWATHGSKTVSNSHPHVSSDGKVMIVHNGIIENYLELREDLKEKGYIFSSETDSEVIANLIASEFTDDPLKSIESCIQKMNGTWAIVVLFLGINKLFCTRHGSPLVVGYSNNLFMVSSEISGFCNKFNSFYALENNDICIAECGLDRLHVKTNEVYSLTDIQKNNNSDKMNYEHWTLKEIHEQPESCIRAINLGGRINGNNVHFGGLERYKKKLENVEHLIIIGCGTSYYASMVSTHNFKKLKSFTSVTSINGCEFDIHDIPKKGKSCVIVLSQSGETRDLYQCIQKIREYDESIIIIGVVNVVDSLISREVDCGCYLNAGREIGVASTKSFTSQVIVMSMISIWFSQLEGNSHERNLEDLRKLPNNIKLLLENLKNKIEPYIKKLLHPSIFLLGRGMMEGVCYEGGLKIKEISYIHAEGFSGASLKHGPFALLSDDVPVILIISKEDSKSMINTYNQVCSRGAFVLIISDDEEIVKKYGGILIPRNKYYSHILFVIVLQYIAYLLSIEKGLNPDFPRNLAKVVTVD